MKRRDKDTDEATKCCPKERLVGTTFEVAHRYLCSDSSWDGGEEIKMKETNGVAATTKEKTAATP